MCLSLLFLFLYLSFSFLLKQLHGRHGEEVRVLSEEQKPRWKSLTCASSSCSSWRNHIQQNRTAQVRWFRWQGAQRTNSEETRCLCWVPTSVLGAVFILLHTSILVFLIHKVQKKLPRHKNRPHREKVVLQIAHTIPWQQIKWSPSSKFWSWTLLHSNHSSYKCYTKKNSLLDCTVLEIYYNRGWIVAMMIDVHPVS